ncbi:unnamed protein product, partial [Didymodactylos carnosus]
MVGSPLRDDDINMDAGKELNSTQEMSDDSDDSSSEEERYELESDDDDDREENDGGGVDSKSKFHCYGVSVYDINNQLSVWPFFMVVNEMPLKYRFESSNLILFTCWSADIKLDRQRMQILLNKMVKMMLLYEHGITLINPDGMSIKVRVFMFIGVIDKVARCKVENHIQYNGEYGCAICGQP